MYFRRLTYRSICEWCSVCVWHEKLVKTNEVCDERCVNWKTGKKRNFEWIKRTISNFHPIRPLVCSLSLKSHINLIFLKFHEVKINECNVIWWVCDCMLLRIIFAKWTGREYCKKKSGDSGLKSEFLFSLASCQNFAQTKATIKCNSLRRFIA